MIWLARYGGYQGVLSKLWNAMEPFRGRALSPKLNRRSQTGGAKGGSYANRFAAKEACSRPWDRLRRGFLEDMGVVNEPSGRPTMQLTGGAKEQLERITPAGHLARIQLTITDDYPYAQAIVIIEAVATP